MTKFSISQLQSSHSDNSDLNIKEIIYLMRRHLPLITITISTFFILSVLYTLMQIPTYTSTTMVVVEDKSQTGSMFDLGFETNLSLINTMNNEIELLKSRTLSEEVVNDLWYSPHKNNLFLYGSKCYKPEGIKKTLRGLWDSIFNRKNVPKSYVQDAGISDSLFLKAAETLRKNMSVTNDRNSNVLKISMTSNDPDESALLANTVARLYQQRDMEWSAGEIINLRRFLQDQAKQVESELHLVEDSLRQFQEREQIFELEGNAKQLLDQLGQIDTKYRSALAEINIIRERRRYIDSKLSQEEKTLKGQLLNSIDTRLLALRTEIAQTDANLVRNASTYGENHEAVLSLRRKLTRLKSDLEEQTNQLIAGGTSVADPLKYRQALIDTSLFLESRLANYQSIAAEYKKIVNQYNRQLSTLPAKSVQFAQLERDRSVLAETYSLMRQKFEEARITEASQLGKIRIIDPAIPPLNRTSPNTKINLAVGLLLGLGLGALTAFLIEQTDNSIKNVSEIEHKGLNVLGIIPDISKAIYATKKRRKKKKTQKTPKGHKGTINVASDIKRRIITKEDPRSPISEAYRSLRTSISYASVDNPTKTIIVTSPGPGEGKTTTITNLAITFANIGKRTLLVDADLRRPVIHRIFNLNIEPGVTHYLTGFPRDIHPLIKQTEIKNLQVITAGATPPDPSVLLSSKRMHEFIKSLEIGWDVILFDAPPAIAVTDTSLLA
ncbi:MAG: polysaccharide biosynthesis tyrosine autokinase, partial [Planctomycetia bacterium]|nr:polysaccharide biosynthesis tyrosine autokinase [Planctomycetia bacterium]